MIHIGPDVRGLIFDCDGTLADSMPLHMEAWEQAFVGSGEPYRPEFLDPLRGMHEEEIVVLYNQRYQRNLDPRAVVDRKHAHFKKSVHLIEPVESVVEVVNRFRDELPLAVVSGGRRETVTLTLEGLGIVGFFSVVLTADDPIPPKPAPDLFLEAARRIKVAPELCHVFEDGDMGLDAARRAGMTATDVRGFI